MAWWLTGHFELTDALFSFVTRECSSKRRRSSTDGTISKELCAVVYIEEDGFMPVDAEKPVSEDAFTLLNFHYLCYNTDLVHEDGSSGLTYKEMSNLFLRTSEQMPTLLQ